MKLTESVVLASARVDSLQHVKNLNLWGRQLTDISILSKLPNLEVLSLSLNRISSLKDLQNCHKLQELYLRKNEIGDLCEIFFLKNLPRLKILWLNENPCAANDSLYRKRVISVLAKLDKLDDSDITLDEKQTAFESGLSLELEKQFNQKHSAQPTDFNSVEKPTRQQPLQQQTEKPPQQNVIYTQNNIVANNNNYYSNSPLTAQQQQQQQPVRRSRWSNAPAADLPVVKPNSSDHVFLLEEPPVKKVVQEPLENRQQQQQLVVPIQNLPEIHHEDEESDDGGIAVPHVLPAVNMPSSSTPQQHHPQQHQQLQHSSTNVVSAIMLLLKDLDITSLKMLKREIDTKIAISHK